MPECADIGHAKSRRVPLGKKIIDIKKSAKVHFCGPAKIFYPGMMLFDIKIFGGTQTLNVFQKINRSYAMMMP
jgi:hypothetical protein